MQPYYPSCSECKIYRYFPCVLIVSTGPNACAARAPHQKTTLVIGAYPPSGKYGLCRGSKADHAKAPVNVTKVPPQAVYPVFGPTGPLIALWHA
jgi:uncharacterized protein YjlB